MSGTPQKTALILHANERFAAARLLAAQVPAALLRHRKRPLLVHIAGSEASGKSIFAEAFREIVFGQNPKHFYGYDIYETGRLLGRKTEINFIDISYMAGYQLKPLNFMQDDVAKEMVFLAERRHGGISLVQNPAPEARALGPDIEIWVETPEGRIVQDYPRRAGDLTGRLRETFLDFSRRREISYYVEITINDNRLTRNGRPLAALEQAGFGA